MRNFYLLFFLLFTYTLSAQSPFTIQYSVKDGLPSKNVYNSFSDSKGFMWFCTDLGVSKFDGYKFQYYGTEDGLADNEVFSFFEDSEKRIWLLSYNGKLSYYKNGKFYNEKNNTLLHSESNNGYLKQIIESNKNQLLFLFSNGTLTEINFLTKTKKSIINKNILVLFKINQSVNYLTKTDIINTKSNSNTKHKILNFGVFDVVRSFENSREIYFSYQNKIYNFNKSSKIITLFKTLNIPNGNIIYLYIDAKKSFWIGTREGLYHKSNTDLDFKIYFKNNSFSSINEDFEGNLWFTTLDNGVYYNPNPFTFKVEDKNIESKSISFLTTKNDLWASTSEDEYFKINSSIIPYKLKQENNLKNKITQIYFHENDTYIIGKHGIQINGNHLPFVGTNNILIQKDTIWLGANYLLKFHKKDILNLKNENLLSTNNSVIIKEKTNKLIYVKNQIFAATNVGLYSVKNNRVTYISKNHPNSQTVLNDLYYDGTTNLLFASSPSKGIFVFKNNQLINQITTKKNLNSNLITSIKIGFNSEKLFITNSLGLNELNLKTFQIINLNKFIGIENVKFNSTEIYNNQLYLATDDGLLYINSNKLFENKTNPKLVIENIKVNNQNSNQSVFKHFENDIEFSFTGLSFRSQKNIVYYYKLNNDAENWKTTTSKLLSFKSLQPGNYKLQLYAKDAFGNKSKPFTYTFIIEKPFWKTTWFISLLFISFGIALFLIWKKREKEINEKFEFERKKIEFERDKANIDRNLIDLEQKALRMQMNPHFIFNALNTIKGYYAKGYDEKAGDYIAKFSQLLRMLLENTDQFISLSEEIKMLNLYLELTQIRYKNKFNFSFVIDSNINQEEAAIPPMLLQPMIENAIIHGLAPKNESGNLIVNFKKVNDNLYCIVEDDGIGLTASKEKKQYNSTSHESKAIEITKERIKLFTNDINNSFEIKEQTNTQGKVLGTKVTIILPYQNIWE